MQRINGPGHLNNMFVAEDPTINRPPTEITAEWLNQTQEELLSVIEAAGLVPSSAVQFVSALQKLFVFDAVPAQYKGDVITVRLPHLRCMIWSGTTYVRAPWHQPCQLFFSYDNPSSILGALPVRADVSYQQSNYPDVVARLGLSGSGTFSLVESRGEFLRVLDNGRGVDVSRVARSAQSDQLQLHMHNLPTGANGFDPLVKWGVSDQYWERIVGGVNGNPSGTYPSEMANTFRDGQVGNFGSETRPRNVAFPLWMTI